MDCKTVEYCVSAFFEDNIDIQLRYEVVCHLLKCAKCYQIYEDYAKSERLHFDIVREVSRVELMRKEVPQGEAIYMTKRKKYQNMEFKVPAVYKQNPMKDEPDRWTTACKHNDYSELMNLKAVRDIYKAENNTKDYSDYKRDFVNFLTKKICQKIDFLEKCLNIKEDEKDA